MGSLARWGRELYQWPEERLHAAQGKTASINTFLKHFRFVSSCSLQEAATHIQANLALTPTMVSLELVNSWAYRTPH